MPDEIPPGVEPETPTVPEAAPEAAPLAPEAEEPFDEARAKEKIRKANSEAENLRKRLKELEPLAQKAKDAEDAQKTAEERAREAADAATKRADSYRDRAVTAEIRSRAAGFADPDDAVGALNPADYVDADGEIDTARMAADLAALLERKPHWRAADPGPRRPAPDRTQGSSGNGGRTPNTPGEQFAAFMGRAMQRGR